MTEKQARLWDYLVLSARFLIGWTLMDYGFSKLTAGQFGITPVEMGTAVKDISLFRLSWYVFDHEPFKAFIGISQLIAGGLMIYNKTALLGVLLSIPILVNILVIDMTIMPLALRSGFIHRLSFYLLLEGLVLWHYRDRMLIVWKQLSSGISTRYRFPFWAYLLLPLSAILLEILSILSRLLFQLIVAPEVLWVNTLDFIHKMCEHLAS